MVGNQPIYPAAPNALPVLIVATGNTARDGTGTITTVMTAGVVGGRIDRIYLKATGTTTAGMLRVFAKASGGTYRLIGEVSVTAVTPSGTVASWEGVWTPAGAAIPMNAGEVIGVATHNAEEFTALPSGGDV